MAINETTNLGQHFVKKLNYDVLLHGSKSFYNFIFIVLIQKVCGSSEIQSELIILLQVSDRGFLQNKLGVHIFIFNLNTTFGNVELILSKYYLPSLMYLCSLLFVYVLLNPLLLVLIFISINWKIIILIIDLYVLFKV